MKNIVRLLIAVLSIIGITCLAVPFAQAQEKAQEQTPSKEKVPDSEVDLQKNPLRLQLIWGTDSTTTNYPAVSPRIKKRFDKFLKWENYYEINRKKILLDDTKEHTVSMSEECELKLTRLDKKNIEVQVFGRGKLVIKKKAEITTKRPQAISGQDEKTSTFWCVLITVSDNKDGDDAQIAENVKSGEDNCFVAAYYFPNYHYGDARNEKLKGKGWSEWEVVKAAKPHYEGQYQPRVPAWGYTDESDPVQMAQKIDAAANHGINAFIFDWYYYNDGPFLERGLEQGFLNATNNNRLKFALMWANHDWLDMHPWKYSNPAKFDLLYPGKVTPETFDKVCDYVIEKYFKHPSYWCIDGKPYFSIYELSKLMESFGSVEATREALNKFREKAKAAGFEGVHLNAVLWGRPNLPGEQTVLEPDKLLTGLGFDSFTSYVWIHHVWFNNFPTTDYTYVRDKYWEYWDKIEKQVPLPYFPNVSVGWDNTPRGDQDGPYANGVPFMQCIGGNTPEAFAEALKETRKRLATRPYQIFNINCWNEWTEGSYLEPDEKNGMKYLEAVRDSK